MRDAAHTAQPPEADDYRLRRNMRTGLEQIIATGQRAGIFRDGDPQALTTLIFAALDTRLSAALEAGGSQGRDAAASPGTSLIAPGTA